VLNQTGGWLFLNTQAFNNHSVTLYQGGNLVLHALGDNTSNPERLTTAGTIISPGTADYNLWVQAQYSDLMPIRAANKTIALTTPITFAGQNIALDNAANQGGLGPGVRRRRHAERRRPLLHLPGDARLQQGAGPHDLLAPSPDPATSSRMALARSS